MAARFAESLFNAIFIPGVPPVLAYTTNGSFAILQLLLLGLLYATRSIHYFNMSIICAGLWWAINWFIREMELAKQTSPNAVTATGEAEKLALDSDDGTETEAEIETQGNPGSKSSRRRRRGEISEQSSAESSTILDPATGASGVEIDQGVTRRNLADSTASTDSEWDKLEPELGRRDRRQG